MTTTSLLHNNIETTEKEKQQWIDAVKVKDAQPEFYH